MSLLFTNATKVDADGVVDDFWMLTEGPTITATGVGTASAPSDAAVSEVVDLRGAPLTPGLVDLHVHGGATHSFDDGTAEIEAALALHRAHGTTRSLISLVANPLPALKQSLQAISELVSHDPLVLGAHLEGPFLSPDNRGAHHPGFLAEPTPQAVTDLQNAAAGSLRLITIAPELSGALDAIETLVAAGVVVAVGHTVADYDITRAAFDRGATVLTHAFNAMPGIHHRAPGPLVAAFDDGRVTLELILDGVHVHPSVARLLFEAAPGRVALITDAMAAAGAPDGPYRLGELDVVVTDGQAMLADGSSIAGSTLTQDAALRIAIAEARLPAVEAVAALTLTPARALGLDDRIGTLAPGKASDAVAWTDSWHVHRVWAAGSPL